MKAICLLSGGLDSATTLAYAKNKGYQIYALTFSYGQRHNREIDAAIKLAKYYRVKEHKIVNIDFLKELTRGASALTDRRIKLVERKRIPHDKKDVPSSYVPFRNTIFLSIATSYAESIKANILFIGANKLDYTGYPDCRPAYFRAMEGVIRLGTKACTAHEQSIKIKLPLLNKTKTAIISLARKLRIPLGLTWSCYQGRAKACGKCDACLLRLEGFKKVDITDPIKYEN